MHAVRFYQDAPSLGALVAGFLADGIAGGEPAIIIATPDHRAALLHELGAMAFEPRALVCRATVLLLDPGETLRMIMRNGLPDPALFSQTLGDIIAAATQAAPGSTVRIYGDLMDVLWKRGQKAAAIRLEVLWNELAARQPFRLLCGYALDNGYGAPELQDICGQHSEAVLPANAAL